ncbi:zinc finger protein 418-like isoform X2 [Ostrinia nubilalis]|uniref:zinc finger protein 418-like isoform X2 n=1 Tax=Ostrinia nubilalis TaxID=29057 RepID=UPI0030822720
MSGESWKLEQDLCRCCHSEGAHKNLSEACIDGEDEILSDMLHDTLDITINPVTGPLGLVTYTICEPCMMRLQDAWSFKQQVVDCERRFHELYSRNALKMDPDNVIVVDVKQEVDLPIVVKTSPNEGVKEERLHSDDEDFLPVDDVQSDLSDQEQTKKKRKPRGRPKAPPKIKRTPRHAQNKTQKVDDSTADDGKEKKDAPTNSSLLGSTVCLSNSKICKSYTCIECGKKEDKPGKVKDHIYKSHLENATTTTCFCKKKFGNQTRLDYHIKNVHTLFECNVCAKGFMKKKLQRHKAEVHGLPKKLPTCGVCGYKCMTEHLLVEHQRRVHLKEKNVQCPQCGEMFFDNGYLKLHQVKHNPVMKFKCRFCNKTYPRNHTLSRHEKIHTKDMRKKCEVCGQMFVQKASLSYHMKKYHPEKV